MRILDAPAWENDDRGMFPRSGGNYFLSLASFEGSFNSARIQKMRAGPKQIKTPIGIAQILINLSIGFKKYSRFGESAQLLCVGPTPDDLEVPI
jgi:hypothetical protein